MYALSVRAGSWRQQAQRWDALAKEPPPAAAGSFNGAGQSMRPAPARWPYVEGAPLANTNNRPAAPERETWATSTSSTVSPSIWAPPPGYILTTPPHPANGRATSSSPKPCCQDEGGRDWKSGEMLFYYSGEGGGEGEENYGGGEINPLSSKVEKLNRLRPLKREWRRTPSYGGGANLPTRRKEFWGLNRPSSGSEEGREPTLSGDFPLEGGRAEVSAGPRPPRWSERKGRP